MVRFETLQFRDGLTPAMLLDARRSSCAGRRRADLRSVPSPARGKQRSWKPWIYFRGDATLTGTAAGCGLDGGSDANVVLDTETTASTRVRRPGSSNGCIEVLSRRVTGNHFHRYINPERESEQGALKVTAIDHEFLQDKPSSRDRGRVPGLHPGAPSS